MKAKDIIGRLTAEDIIKLMNSLGADNLPYNGGNQVLFRTICHAGDSHKLYFFKDSKMFHCYTNCGQLSIFDIVQKVLNTDFLQAKNYIENYFGISSGFNMEMGFNQDLEFESEQDSDLDLLCKYDSKPKEADLTRSYKILDESLLNPYRNMYHPAFYNDHISFETMDKFEIKYDILNNRIIIPHRDENGNLVAIRCRNLDEYMIEIKMKYAPVRIDGKFLSAPTRMYLYGLYQNQESIRRMKKVIIFESEKAVLQLNTFLNGNGFAVALSSSNLHMIQILLLKSFGVEEVIIGLDKEYEEYGSKEEKLYALKIRKSLIDKLKPYFSVSVMWDTSNLLKKKDSPTDRGKEVFQTLYNNRIEIGE